MLARLRTISSSPLPAAASERQRPSARARCEAVQATSTSHGQASAAIHSSFARWPLCVGTRARDTCRDEEANLRFCRDQAIDRSWSIFRPNRRGGRLAGSGESLLVFIAPSPPSIRALSHPRSTLPLSTQTQPARRGGASHARRRVAPATPAAALPGLRNSPTLNQAPPHAPNGAGHDGRDWLHRSYRPRVLPPAPRVPHVKHLQGNASSARCTRCDSCSSGSRRVTVDSSVPV